MKGKSTTNTKKRNWDKRNAAADIEQARGDTTELMGKTTTYHNNDLQTPPSDNVTTIENKYDQLENDQNCEENKEGNPS